MKKFLSLTIVTVMLLASLCACNEKTPSDNDGNINDNDNNYNQNTDDNNNNDENWQPTDDYVPQTKDNTISFVADDEGQYSAYIEKWDTYHLMPSEFDFVHGNDYLSPIVNDNIAWLLVLNNFTQGSLDFDLTVYKFFRNSKTVETYTHNICDREYHYSELYEYFCDFYDDEHGYIFFWDESYALFTNWGTTSFLLTDDGGKTWYSPVCEASVNSSDEDYHPIFAKFISENIAAISYENADCRHGFCGTVGITTDGGKNWRDVSDSLPFPQSLLEADRSRRAEVIGFEYINNEYVLYAKVYVIEGFGQDEIEVNVQFSSTDLESWKLVVE